MSPSALEAAMAHFSDRIVSFNKLIIAAAVAYTGAVSFAHAGAVDPRLAHFHAGKLTHDALVDWTDRCDAVAAEVDAGDAEAAAVANRRFGGDDANTAASPHHASKVSKATLGLMSAWLTLSDQCAKDSGGDVTANPASCAAMHPIGETLAKQGCEMMGGDEASYWICNGVAVKSN
jgi:hypothetical protein